jgi:hypothetical protein
VFDPEILSTSTDTGAHFAAFTRAEEGRRATLGGAVHRRWPRRARARHALARGDDHFIEEERIADAARDTDQLLGIAAVDATRRHFHVLAGQRLRHLLRAQLIRR